MVHLVESILGLKFGHLVLKEVLGIGTYGAVYLGEDCEDNLSRYAVKCLFKSGLAPEFLALQKLEIDFNQRIPKHPYVCHLEEVIETDEVVLLVFEYCSRKDLYEFIEKNGPLSKELACRWFSQLLHGIRHCHENGIYHRDLKPENILLTEQWDVKIADFGLATEELNPRDFECGSQPYMAPEMFGGGGSSNGKKRSWTRRGSESSYSAEKADVWSLGVILFNMLFQKNPWNKARPDDDHFGVFSRDPKEVLGRRFRLTPSFQRLFQRMFDPNSSTRCGLGELIELVDRLDVPEISSVGDYVAQLEAANGGGKKLDKSRASVDDLINDNDDDASQSPERDQPSSSSPLQFWHSEEEEEEEDEGNNNNNNNSRRYNEKSVRRIRAPRKRGGATPKKFAPSSWADETEEMDFDSDSFAFSDDDEKDEGEESGESNDNNDDGGKSSAIVPKSDVSPSSSSSPSSSPSAILFPGNLAISGGGDGSSSGGIFVLEMPGDAVSSAAAAASGNLLPRKGLNFSFNSVAPDSVSPAAMMPVAPGHQHHQYRHHHHHTHHHHGHHPTAAAVATAPLVAP